MNKVTLLLQQFVDYFKVCINSIELKISRLTGWEIPILS